MTARRQRAIVAVTLTLGLVIATTPVRSDDPVSSNVRFTAEIVRIFDRKCLQCHGNDGLAMPLTTYRDVRSWARAIREEIVEQRMPPWTVARGYGRFLNDLSLSAREMTTVLSWIDGGMPRGDDKDLPTPSPPVATDAPDVRTMLPPQRVPARQQHVIKRVSVSMAIDPARPIARVVLSPGAKRVLRGALIYEGHDSAERWVGAWLPWQHTTAPPSPHGFRMSRGGRLIVELHYRGAHEEVSDESAIELYYAPATASSVDEIAVTATTSPRLGRNATLWAIVPSAADGTQSFQLTARRPGRSPEVILWIPQVHQEWPQALVLDPPLALPAGTAMSIVTHPGDAAGSARLSLFQ